MARLGAPVIASGLGDELAGRTTNRALNRGELCMRLAGTGRGSDKGRHEGCDRLSSRRRLQRLTAGYSLVGRQCRRVANLTFVNSAGLSKTIARAPFNGP